MTAAKVTLRQRRTTSAENLPRVLTDWLEGKPRRADQSSVPWLAMAFPGYVLLPSWWKIWIAAHPDAKPPANYEWLSDESAPQNHPPTWLLAQARKLARKPR